MSHEKNRELISQLNDCAAECNHCATACSEEKDANMLAGCIKLNNDCAEICRLAVSYLSRGSEHTGHVLRACVDICMACARECEEHAHMEHCKVCAETCRDCAQACQQTA
jgi:hypothetical protein